MMALNAETEKWWLWTPKLRNDGGFERQTKEMALNAKRKASNGSERRMKANSGSECQMKVSSGYERRNEW